jgi:hypothetical protein
MHHPLLFQLNFHNIDTWWQQKKKMVAVDYPFKRSLSWNHMMHEKLVMELRASTIWKRYVYFFMIKIDLWQDNSIIVIFGIVCKAPINTKQIHALKSLVCLFFTKSNPCFESRRKGYENRIQTSFLIVIKKHIYWVYCFDLIYQLNKMRSCIPSPNKVNVPVFFFFFFFFLTLYF